MFIVPLQRLDIFRKNILRKALQYYQYPATEK